MEENWKPVNGYEDIYEVSDTGNVRSIVSRGPVVSGHVLVGEFCKHGYKRVLLTNVCRKKFLVHRLVASAFIPNPENKPEVNHRDGDKGNNSKSNLEWATPKENGEHASHILGVNRGSKNHSSKLNESDIDHIRTLKFFEATNKSLSECFCVSRSTVSKILTRVIWA